MQESPIARETSRHKDTLLQVSCEPSVWWLEPWTSWTTTSPSAIDNNGITAFIIASSILSHFHTCLNQRDISVQQLNRIRTIYTLSLFLNWQRERKAEKPNYFSPLHRHRRLPYLAVPLRTFCFANNPRSSSQDTDWSRGGSRMCLHEFANRKRENAFVKWLPEKQEVRYDRVINMEHKCGKYNNRRRYYALKLGLYRHSLSILIQIYCAELW